MRDDGNLGHDDIPSDEEYYVHRIGRTGRAGRTGTAITFVSGKELYKLRDIP